MTTNIQELRAEDVPSSWLICYNNECPMRDECLRYYVAPIVGSNLDHGPAVYPSALVDGKCRFYVDKQPIRLAWGFRPLFTKVRHEDYATLRWKVMALFSSDSKFFRYNRGDFKLTPEQQQEVLDIFRRKGYDTTDMHFAHYEDTYKFNT